MTPSLPARQVRALFSDRTVTVYQAYSPPIAEAAVAAGGFVAPFKRDRMTWIKPSLLWMAYRSGWASKPGQERVLAVEITRAGFEWALTHSCLSHFDPAVHDTREDWKEQLAASPVRIQWDPERSLTLEPLSHRAIQIGLGGDAVERYVGEWTVAIVDVTDLVHDLSAMVSAGDHQRARSMLPEERAYPLPGGIAVRIGASAHR